jgi:VWFA-related protein
MTYVPFNHNRSVCTLFVRLFSIGGLALLALLGGDTRGQQEPKIAVDVKTVNVIATVRDKHGKIVPDLNQNAFVLTEDGRPQSINYFAKETVLPLRLGLLVDTSLSQRRVLDQERSASYSFLDNLLREKKDLAFVVNFDFDVTLLQDFTDARPKLQAALQSLDTPQLSSRGRGGSGGPGGGSGGDPTSGGGTGRGGRRGGGTHLYDAIFLASDELMGKQQGRKALIVLSDGVDHGSQETLAYAIETAQRSDTIVYSILYADEEGFGSHPSFGMGPGGHGGHGGRYPQQQEHVDGKKILEEISKKTGGLQKRNSRKDLRRN